MSKTTTTTTTVVIAWQHGNDGHWSHRRGSEVCAVEAPCSADLQQAALYDNRVALLEFASRTHAYGVPVLNDLVINIPTIRGPRTFLINYQRASQVERTGIPLPELDDDAYWRGAHDVAHYVLVRIHRDAYERVGERFDAQLRARPTRRLAAIADLARKAWWGYLADKKGTPQRDVALVSLPTLTRPGCMPPYEGAGL